MWCALAEAGFDSLLVAQVQTGYWPSHGRAGIPDALGHANQRTESKNPTVPPPTRRSLLDPNRVP